MTPAEVETYRKTQAALVKHEFVANAALRDAKVRELEVVREQPDAAAWLAACVTAEYGEGSSVLRVGVTGVPPREGAILANAVAGAYLSETAQVEIGAQRERLGRLDDAHAELAKALDARRRELGRRAGEFGVPANRGTIARSTSK